MGTFSRRAVSSLFLACGLFLCGCGGGSPLNKANYDKIQNGMTPKEVGALFGFDESFEKVEEGKTIMLGKQVSSKLGVDRRRDFPTEDEMIDVYSTKELGGTNKKEIIVNYKGGVVEGKNQQGVE